MLLAASALLAGVSAQAQVTVSAYSDYSQNDTILLQNNYTDSAYAYASTWGGASNGWAFASVDGSLDTYAIAGHCGEACSWEVVPPPAASFTASTLSEARWETTVLNDFGSAQDYSFHFNIADHYLQTTGRAGDRAGFGIDILLNGSSIWSANALLEGATLSYSPEFGAPEDGSWGDDWYAYSFSDLSMTVDLGSIAFGSSFTLSYAMTAFVEAVIDADEIHVDIYEDGDDFWGWWWVSRDPVISGVRDPLGVSFTNEPSTSVPAVPEPASWAMLVAGFGLMGGFLRRRQPVTA